MDLKIKLFADGADKSGILEMDKNPQISGFTTNPTLMKAAGIKDYKAFSLDILSHIKEKPISLEVFSDDFIEMEKQALEIASWANNVYVKIPITNTKSESSLDLIHSLSNQGVKLNITAMMTVQQVESILPALSAGEGSYVSVFAGRIADAGVDPLPIMSEVVSMLTNHSNIELIWASPRELYNVIQANDIGCHIITATNDILKKLPTLGKNLDQFSLETVKMFYDDAKEAGFSI
ncbi:MAG: transaldolase [Candidatus Marinimicrobia bacterium]|nr:transaldolase [Candidatus Neomarinimicrobiota bacterium]